MRRLEVDLSREGDGSLVAREYVTLPAPPYELPEVLNVATHRVTAAERGIPPRALRVRGDRGPPERRSQVRGGHRAVRFLRSW